RCLEKHAGDYHSDPPEAAGTVAGPVDACRVADRRKPTAGTRQAVAATSAILIDVTVPSAPIAGPPVHCPTASAWLTMESVVARTAEASTLRLSPAAAHLHAARAVAT